MTYSDATDSYQADFLENILGTKYRYNVPYKIDKVKYAEVVKRFGKSSNLKRATVVSFFSDYSVHDREKSYAFYTWSQNTKEHYDCFQFWRHTYKGKQRKAYEDFVKALLECVIEPDYDRVSDLQEKLTAQKNEIDNQLKLLINL